MSHGIGKTKATKKAAKKAGLKIKKVKLNKLKKKDLLGFPVSDLSQASDVHTSTVAETKIWFCFRGPYDCSAWAQLWTKQELLKFFDDHEVVGPVLKEHPDFETLRVESCRGDADEDGRIYIWGEDQPGADGIDTEHEGYKIELDGKVVFNTMKPSSESKEGHDEDCEECAK